MSKIVDINTDNINDPNVYITARTFRDPVLAKDDYIYEREAITKFILEQGTSPFTGQPLQKDDLRSDDRLRLLAEQHRNEQLAEKSEKIMDYRIPTKPLISDDLSEENRPATKNIRDGLIIIIILLICLIGLILGITIVGFQFYSAGMRNYIIHIY